MKVQQIRDRIPPSYQEWLPEFFDLEVPSEEIADCFNCPMTRPTKYSRNRQFSKDTKCCTYHPSLPNFLVGGILEESPGFGKAALVEKFSSRIGFTPIMLRPPKKDAFRFDKFKHLVFGLSKNLLCPFYDNGSCSIWEFREPMCALWFCHSVGGQVGRSFWELLRESMTAINLELSQRIAKELGIDVNNFQEYRFENVRSEADLAEMTLDQYELLWGDWKDREMEYYRECYRLFIGLRPSKRRAWLDAVWNRYLPDLETKRKLFIESVSPAN